MSRRLAPEAEAFVRERHAAGELLGASVDEDEQEITLFVPAGEALTGFPYELDGLRVSVVPLPRPRMFRSAS